MTTSSLQATNRQLMQQARDALRGKWGLAVRTLFVYMLIAAISQIPLIGFFISIFLIPPLYIGWNIFSLAISRNKSASTSQLFEGFNQYWSAVGLYLLVIIFVALWTLLLIIPGIIAGLSYAMAPYILIDNPSISALDAIRQSKQMMYGYKWKLFDLYLRFLGWMLLSILTLGIGLLWVIPYANISAAKFYDDLLKSTTGHPGSSRF